MQTPFLQVILQRDFTAFVLSNKLLSKFVTTFSFVLLCLILSLLQSLQSDGSEVLLSPEVTCGPPDMLVTTPFALTIPHCADVSSEHWTIHLKKRTQQGKWEVRCCLAFCFNGIWVLWMVYI